jgi:hypothetical protein
MEADYNVSLRDGQIERAQFSLDLLVKETKCKGYSDP